VRADLGEHRGTGPVPRCSGTDRARRRPSMPLRRRTTGMAVTGSASGRDQTLTSTVVSTFALPADNMLDPDQHYQGTECGTITTELLVVRRFDTV
jgi:hypothetical protein